MSEQFLVQAFPFYLECDRALKIIRVGEAIPQLYRELTLNQPLFEYFKVTSSEFPLEFESLQENESIEILLEDLNQILCFKGQAIYHGMRDTVLLLIHPWISDPKVLEVLERPVKARRHLEARFKDSITNFLLLIKARSANLTEIFQIAEQLTQKQNRLHHISNNIITEIIEHFEDSVEIIDADFTIHYVNQAFEELTGYSRQEVIGNPFTDFSQAGQAESLFNEGVWQTISTNQLWQGQYVGICKDKSTYHQAATIFPIQNKLGQVSHYGIIKRDLNRSERKVSKLEQSLAILKATCEATVDGILAMDVRGKVLHFNQKFIDLWKIPENLITSLDHRQLMRHLGSKIHNYDEFSIQKFARLYVRPYGERCDTLDLKDGRVLEWYSNPQEMDGLVIGWVWSFRDVTERQQREERIRYQASHDLLSGLPNRKLFNERLLTALKTAQQENRQLAVMFLDLDRFKLVNDTLGHEIGDQLIQTTTQRLQACLKKNNTLARWGGDEFTLLVPDMNSRDEAIAIAHQLLDTFKLDFHLGQHTLRISVSIGVAIYPTDGRDAETLLKNADVALYRAKEEGRNTYELYHSKIDSVSSETLLLENNLHSALKRQELELHYQPQVNAVTGKILQMEALLRWRHPEMGLLYPSEFIKIAEETGLIVDIGDWVIHTACTQNRAWQQAGLGKLRMAVNLSARQFKQPDLIEKICQMLSASDLEPQDLELEITETTVMKNVDLTKQKLYDLSDLGISIAMDDFGTGYSSLSYLKKFPFQTLKVDQSFVRDLTKDPNDKAIVAAIIAMGGALNLDLVAEGVETRKQVNALLSLGCEVMQGHLFSPALTSAAATKFLQKYATIS
ncbi:MAG: EAL domain-containing protein [Cyanobacteria bacterium J06638_28]